MAFVSLKIPDWILASPEMTLGAKILLARLITLSATGKRPVYFKRANAISAFGISRRAISNYFAELIDAGYLRATKNPDPWSRVRNFEITDLALTPDCVGAKNATSRGQNLQHRESKKCNIDVAKPARGGGQNLQHEGAKFATSSIDQKQTIDKKDGRIISSLDLKDPRACARDDADDDVSQLASPSWWDEIPDPEDWDAPAEPEETTELKTVEPVVSSEPAAAPAPAPAQRPAPSPAPAPARPKIKRPYSLATGDIPDEMVPGYAKAWFGDLLTENKPAPKADNSAPKPEASIEQKTEPVPAVVDHPIAQTPLASQETARNAPIGGFNVYTPCQETKINPWGSTCVSEFVPPAPPKYTHPQNEDEVYNQMVRYYSEHVLEQPELQTIKDDLHVISENFWDYWDEKHWMRNGSPITSYRRIISNWLTKASRDKQQALSKQPAKSFQQQERDYRAQLDREAEAFQAKLIADAERNKQQLSSPTFELLSNTSNF